MPTRQAAPTSQADGPAHETEDRSSRPSADASHAAATLLVRRMLQPAAAPGPAPAPAPTTQHAPAAHAPAKPTPMTAEHAPTTEARPRPSATPGPAPTPAPAPTVAEPPPAETIADVLLCVRTASAVRTAPTIHEDMSGATGHAFLQISLKPGVAPPAWIDAQTQQILVAQGSVIVDFIPAEAVKFDPRHSQVAGSVLMRERESPSAEMKYSLTESQLQAVFTYAYSKQGTQYDPYRYNCVDFALDSLKAAGIEPPNANLAYGPEAMKHAAEHVPGLAPASYTLDKLNRAAQRMHVHVPGSSAPSELYASILEAEESGDPNAHTEPLQSWTDENGKLVTERQR